MKIYLVGLYHEDESQQDIQSIVAAYTSYSVARAYVLDKILNFSQYDKIFDYNCVEDETKYHWTITYKHKGIDTKDSPEREMFYRIEPIDLNDKDEIPGVNIPSMELTFNALQKQNDELKDQIAELSKNISAAQCYLTFYDGGIYEDFDHLLKNIYKAKSILRGDEKGNTYITKLYENWCEHKCKMCKDHESKK